MPYCRLCKQNYPENQFVSGNGPRYLVCARCAIEHDLADEDEVPQLYSDDLVLLVIIFSLSYIDIILWILGTHF